MYPYFQKNRKPNPSNPSGLSVREASPADPLRQFLAENPAFGTLLFQVTGGQGAVPIERATVVISKALPNWRTLSVTTMTDESGKTAEISLPAPRRDKSQTPGGTDVFATYDALIFAPGTEFIKKEEERHGFTADSNHSRNNYGTSGAAESACGKRNRAVSRLYQKCGLQRDLSHMARSRNSREYLRTDYLCAEPHI